MPIRVAQIIPTLVEGGAEKQMSLLAMNLDRQQFESHVVVLTHSGPWEERLRDSRLPVHLIGKKWKGDPGAWFRLVAKLREIQPDIVHTWLFAANSFGRSAALRSRVPTIFGGERCVDPWKAGWQLAIDRYLTKRTTGIITNTGAIADFYAAKGIPADRFHVIPNAVLPPAQPRLSKQELFERLDIEPRSKVIVAIGRLWKQKGYRDLFWAAELLRVAHDDMWLIVVGDGPERDDLLKYRDQISAHRAVKMVGHRSDASEILSAADLLWNGSIYEGQSNTILESMTMGVPAVATDIPGTRDLIVHDQTGILYPLGDIEALTRASLSLLTDDRLRTAMGERAQQRAELEFSLEKMVSAHAEHYLTHAHR